MYDPHSPWKRRYLVGRELELRTMLEAARRSSPLIYLYGPGGLGKSTLLGRFVDACRAEGIATFVVDTATCDGSITSLEGAIASAIGGASLEGFAGRAVLCIDEIEKLVPLHAWLRATLLPRLEGRLTLVLSGRTPPSSDWWMLGGWNDRLHAIRLPNLSADETREFLGLRGIPADRHEAALRLTHGHPLALWLLGDALLANPDLSLRETPLSVVRTLVDHYLDHVTDAEQRAALEVAALVRVTTEPLLAELLERADVHALFRWLGERPFVEHHARGLRGHDLFADVVSAELAWRNPERHARLVDMALRCSFLRAGPTHEEQTQAALDRFHLIRHTSWARGLFDTRAMEGLRIDFASPSDRPAMIELIAGFEGEASAAIASAWLERPTTRAGIVSDGGDRPAGVEVTAVLGQGAPDDDLFDPAAAAVWREIARRGPLRPGERALVQRFWLARDTYQQPSPVQNFLAASSFRHVFQVGGVRYYFYVDSDPDFWAAIAAPLGVVRMPECDFVVGGRRYGILLHDFSVRPCEDLLRDLARHLMGTSTPERFEVSAPVVQIGADEMRKVVREALQLIHDDRGLAASPLVHSRLAWLRAGPNPSDRDRVEAIRSTLRRAVESLAAVPRHVRAYRALTQTYFEGVEVQKQAAASLGLPFSTYRRHLDEGIALVAEHLVALETGG